MKKREIDSIAYLMKPKYDENGREIPCDEEDKKKPIVLLGAGASVSAGIPGADAIMNDILEEHKNKPEIKALQKSGEKIDYYSVMACLSANERHKLLREYISGEDVRINVTHIYLAQLLRQGYIEVDPKSWREKEQN